MDEQRLTLLIDELLMPSNSDHFVAERNEWMARFAHRAQWHEERPNELWLMTMQGDVFKVVVERRERLPD